MRIAENGEELPPLPGLPSEVWSRIFEYVFSSAFPGNDIERIGFATQKIMLMGVLSDYRNSLWKVFQRSKTNATNAILSQVNEANDCKSLTDVLHTSEAEDIISKNSTLLEIGQTWRERFPAAVDASDDDLTSESDAVEGAEASEDNNATPPNESQISASP